MEDERGIDRWFAFDDATNCPNPWQETLRFGLLDPVRLGARIAADRALADARIALHPSLALTCLDQARGALAWIEDARIRTGSVDALVETLEAATGLPLAVRFASHAN